ncbi:MAG: dTMP kinase [Cohaesibacteraceae bacterium]|nr:dTMP kinase [Cohaesibacteraceae bacterium]
MKGKFITFEGGEAVGKSTQISRLARHLVDNNIDVVTTREPGGSAGAEIMRHILKTGAARAMGLDDFGEALLFAAARADHVDVTIRPALESGQWVLCDRFVDSTRVYQGTSGKLTKHVLDRLEHVATAGLMPDLTLLLDLRADIGIARAKTRREATNEVTDRFEAEDLKIQEKWRQTYLDIARKNRKRFEVIDASRSIDNIGIEIWSVVKNRYIENQFSKVKD